MKVTKLTLAVAALSAGTLLLTGCEPADTAGGSGAADGGGLSCDSKGWGPLSGCHGGEGAAGGESSDGADSSGPEDDEPAGADAAPCEAEESSPDLDAWGLSDSDEGSKRVATDQYGCVADSSPEFKRKIRDWDQKVAEAAEDGTTVHVTWIVVSIDVTGFRECVITLREAPPDPGDHVSRRVTTTEDCEVQQVDAVYRPVGK